MMAEVPGSSDFGFVFECAWEVVNKGITLFTGYILITFMLALYVKSSLKKILLKSFRTNQ